MKEITRIHIAKVAYDIELHAKKELENYIAALERYAGDKELLADIEIRITELLAERGVQADGVISSDDVAAVRAQLGEPSDFAPEGEEAVHELNNEPRRVYRDTDSAVLGGVLSGFARFFGIDPLWLRLLFIVLMFASLGMALVIYLVLWLIIPPARTAAERLRMSGKLVTLASIKELSGSEDRPNETARIVRRVLSSGAGVAFIFAGIGSLLFTIVVSARLIFGIGSFPLESFLQPKNGAPWWVLTAFGLFILAGLLLSILCFILANAIFRRHWTKRIGMTVGTIIISGLLVFASGVAVCAYGYFGEENHISALFKTTSGDLPANFSNVKTVTMSGNESFGVVEYSVSDTPHYEIQSLPGVKPRIELSNDGTSATVTIEGAIGNNSQPWNHWLNQTVLRVYGPALQNVNVTSYSQTVQYTSSGTQQALNVKVGNVSHFILMGGSYDNVSVATSEGGWASLDESSVGTLHTEGGAIKAGVVRLLDVVQPDTCPSYVLDNDNYDVQVQAVSGGKLIYNGKEKPAVSTSGSCGRVIIGDNRDGEE